METPGYYHRQTSPIRIVVLAIVLVSLTAAWVFRPIWGVWLSMLFVAAIASFILLTMTTLTIQDDGQLLLVEFGPTPLFSTRIDFAAIREFRVTRSKIIDGWGIHYIPGRGWTWSLWGFDCLEIEREHGTIRLGTDDADNLASFLRERTSTTRTPVPDFGNSA